MKLRLVNTVYGTLIGVAFGAIAGSATQFGQAYVAMDAVHTISIADAGFLNFHQHMTGGFIQAAIALSCAITARYLGTLHSLPIDRVANVVALFRSPKA